MAFSFLLLAANPASPGPKNAQIKTWLEGAAHTVTYGDDDDAEVAAGTYDAVVIGPNASAVTMANKYDFDYAGPVMATAAWHTATGHNLYSSNTIVSGATQGDVVNASHQAAGGLAAGLHTFLDAAVTVDSAVAGTLAPDAVSIVQVPSSSDVYLFVIESGGTLLSSTTAGARRAFCGLTDEADNMTLADSGTLIVAMCEWLATAPPVATNTGALWRNRQYRRRRVLRQMVWC